jgi:hypothetical protein
MRGQHDDASGFSAGYWRKQADEVNSLAERMRDPIAKKSLQRLAAVYSRMSENANARAAREPKFC